MANLSVTSTTSAQAIPGDQALTIAQADAVKAYGDLAPYRIHLTLERTVGMSITSQKTLALEVAGHVTLSIPILAKSGRGSISSNHQSQKRK